MRFIVVDDERLSLTFFQQVCEEINREYQVEFFLSPLDALDYAEKNPEIDIAFLDIEMPEMTGIEMALRLRQLIPHISIIFVTGHDHYARQAFAVHANGFISKPFDGEEIRTEIEIIQKNRQPAPLPEKKIYIQTFGHFELFVDGERVMFHLSKAKELLAYLVDRNGSAVTTDQAIGVLWEEAPNDVTTQNRFRKTVRSLKQTLEHYGIEDLFQNDRNSKSVNPKLFSCDYYDFLLGKAEAEKRFLGEYMSGYSWGEATLASLLQKQPILWNEKIDI